MILLRRERGDEKVSLDKNCDREVQLRICASRLFHAVGAEGRKSSTTHGMYIPIRNRYLHSTSGSV